MTEEYIGLKVGELTNREEFGRGIIRIDSRSMQKLGIREGDVVELKGQHTTGVIAVRAYPADVGLNVIRMDGLTRRNAGAGVGETLRVKKAEVKEARKIVLAPIQKGVRLQVDPEPIKRNLYMRPVTKKDIITPYPVVRERRSPFFVEDIFDMDVEEFFTPIPGETKLIVVETEPEGITRVTDATELEIKPEAVDISEERGMTTITYEDIGGLEDSILKIREMVELPLRHPELFEKLGIDPPKGVLLYGAPGTGKTLLAKAVANESGAQFFSISGPEFLSKWYGQSLPEDETVLVRHNGTIGHHPIGKLVEKRIQGDVVSFTKDGKVKFSPIKDFIKHPVRSKILEVRTRTGRRIKVTDYHSLFAFDKGKIADVKTSDLKQGKSYIAVPKRLPTMDMDHSFNLIEMLRDSDLWVASAGKYILQARKKLGRQETARILGISEKYLSDIISKDILIPSKKFSRLVNRCKIPYDSKELKVTGKFRKNSIPALINLNEDIARLMGLWLAEGDYNRGSIRISAPDRAIKEEIRRACRNLGIRARIYKNHSRIGSKPLKLLFESLGFKGYSNEKSIPGIMFTLRKPLIAAFLQGYFTGDGSVYPNQRSMLTVEGTTYSQRLANSLLHMLLQFGIVASVYSNPVGKSVRYRICIRGEDNLKKFSEIGFLDKKRDSLVRNFGKKLKWKRSDQIPLYDGLKRILKENRIAAEWQNCRTIGRGKLLEILPKIDPKREKYGDLWQLAESEIYFDRVESIEAVEYRGEYVYDVSINPTENFLAGFGGIFAHNSEQNLRKIFQKAEKNSPSIIFIDEIDSIAPKREEVSGEVERRIVAQLLTLMDGLKSRGKVIVIGATNRQNALDPALRRPGRFDREIELGIPDQKGRKEILQIHTRNMPLTKDVDLDWISSVSHGFVGADLEVLAKEAAMAALRRVLPEISWKKTEALPQDVLEKLKVTKADFSQALKLVEPSAMREVLIEIPDVKWKDIGGLEEIKQLLQEIVVWPMTHQEDFKRIGIKPPTGVLLYGPPGCGKTLIAKAVASETGANFISIRGPEITSKWVGESEKKIREIFRRAKQVAPAVIFFDEIDALATRRGIDNGSRAYENVVSQILVEMSGLEELHNVVVLAASNRPDILDHALLRPGRFEKQLLVPPPDAKSLLEILKIYTKKMPLDKDVDIKKMARHLRGYTGADIEALCREAGLNALRKNMGAKVVTGENFEEAIKKARPSLNKNIIEFYEKIQETFTMPGKREKKKDEEEVRYVG